MLDDLFFSIKASDLSLYKVEMFKDVDIVACKVSALPLLLLKPVAYHLEVSPDRKDSFVVLWDSS
jgi:hypothetical protein